MEPGRPTWPAATPRLPADTCGRQIRKCQSPIEIDRFNGPRTGNGMTARLALLLCKFAIRVLPPGRKPWGAAMEAELHFIDDDRAGVSYATGCLVSAVRERLSDFETRFGAGLWSLAIVSAAFALFHIQCAARGVEVLLGRPDGFLASLVRGGRADAALIERYQSAMPVVIACLFCLGAAHLAAAYCLVRGQLRAFLVTWCFALLIAVSAVAIQLSIVSTGGELPSEFMALLIQAIALPALLIWSHARRAHFEREA